MKQISRIPSASFLLVGALCIFFPSHVAGVLPFLLGGIMLIAGIVHGAAYLRDKRFLEDEPQGIGPDIILAVMGVAFLCAGSEAVGLMGVVWGIIGLRKAAGTIDQALRRMYRHQPALLLATEAAIRIVLALFGVFRWFGDFLPHIFGSTVLFSVAMVLYLLNSRLDASAKLTWLLVITLLPVFGALMYLFTQSDLGHRTLRNRAADMMEQTKDLLTTPADTMERLEQQAPGAASLARYLDRCGSFPAYENTAVTYFPLGEKKFEELLRQLEQAERFIFLEYFIVDEGLMWGRILEILARKAARGLDVRVMYGRDLRAVHAFPRLPEAAAETGHPLQALRPHRPVRLHPLQLPGPPEDPGDRRPHRLYRRGESGGRVHQPHRQARPLEGHGRHAAGRGRPQLHPDVPADVESG